MTSSPDTLTQCPHCGTQFRVTDKQLNAARGKVRCGHCLQVFNALEHALSEETDDTASEPANEEDEEDDLVFDDNPEEDAEEGRYAGHKYHEPQEEDEFNEALLRMESPTEREGWVCLTGLRHTDESGERGP